MSENDLFTLSEERRKVLGKYAVWTSVHQIMKEHGIVDEDLALRVMNRMLPPEKKDGQIIRFSRTTESYQDRKDIFG